MKILTVLNYYHPYISGLSEYARLVAEGIAKSGTGGAEFQVTVLAGQHNSKLPEYESIGGVSVVRYKPLLFLHKGFFSSDFIVRYRRMVREADAVHMHLPMLESGLLGSLTPPNVPIIASYQCDVVPSKTGSVVDRLAVGAVRASNRALLKRATLIAVSSFDYAKGSVALRGQEHKLREVFPPDNAVRSGTAPVSNAGAKRVGFLGRFVEEKGIDVLLDAIPMVTKELPQSKFILAGDYKSVAGGSLIHRLANRLQSLGETVELPGKLSDEELVQFYRSLDLFVLPSINSYEAFGMVQVEAMKAGVPVIASDRRGIRKPIQLTGDGLLVPPGDAPALAKAILQRLTMPNAPSREEISARAWKAFSNERVIEQFAAMYLECSKSARLAS